MWSPTLNLSHSIAGVSFGLIHWTSDYDDEEGRSLKWPANRSRQSKFIPAVPNQEFCSSAKPSWWCLLTRDVGSMQICLSWILKTRKFAFPRPQFAYTQAKRWVITPSTVESVSQPYLTRGPGGNAWKLFGSEDLSQGVYRETRSPPEQNQDCSWKVPQLLISILNQSWGLLLASLNRQSYLGNWQLPGATPPLPAQVKDWHMAPPTVAAGAIWPERMARVSRSFAAWLHSSQEEGRQSQ